VSAPPHGALRHPSFRGLRDDKDPKEIRMKDVQRNAVAAAVATGKSAKRKPTDKPALRDATGASPRKAANAVAGVSLSHPDRVLWPECGITKLDLARYYEAVADRLLPGLARRPLALLRCPEGRTGTCFFQKHPGTTMSEEIPRVPIREKDATRLYMYVEDISHVIRLVQMGAAELHVWGSRVDDLEHPDIMVFDLDPGPGVEWSAVVAGAVRLRALLTELKLDSFTRLTGGKGLHVVVPLEPTHDWDIVKRFSLAVAEMLAREDPKRFTTNMAKAKRKGRIFIDYLRNGRGATAIASYSARAREGAPVAVPVRWSDLAEATPDRFGVATLVRRLSALKKDPWQGFDDARRPLPDEAKRAFALGAKPARRRKASR
jgi:bifunctional non-homologous end joining protein LigD